MIAETLSPHSHLRLLSATPNSELLQRLRHPDLQHANKHPVTNRVSTDKKGPMNELNALHVAPIVYRVELCSEHVMPRFSRPI